MELWMISTEATLYISVSRE